MSSSLQWFAAPGKLNLFLHVLGRRTDGPNAGMHELQTVFRLIDRCDRIGIATRDDGEIRFSGAFGDENLCARAAKALKGNTRSPLGCDIALEKNLPIGGGLGGGSSDAATVLLVLNRFWNLNLNRTDLMDVGLRLGADVPAFLYGRNALGTTTGWHCATHGGFMISSFVLSQLCSNVSFAAMARSDPSGIRWSNSISPEMAAARNATSN